MERLFEGAKDFAIICNGDDEDKIQCRVNHDISDKMMKRVYYSLEEHLRQRGVLPSIPQPLPVREPLGPPVVNTTEVKHEP